MIMSPSPNIGGDVSPCPIGIDAPVPRNSAQFGLFCAHFSHHWLLCGPIDHLLRAELCIQRNEDGQRKGRDEPRGPRLRPCMLTKELYCSSIRRIISHTAELRPN